MFALQFLALIQKYITNSSILHCVTLSATCCWLSSILDPLQPLHDGCSPDGCTGGVLIDFISRRWMSEEQSRKWRHRTQVRPQDGETSRSATSEREQRSVRRVKDEIQKRWVWINDVRVIYSQVDPTGHIRLHLVTSQLHHFPHLLQ